MSLRILQSAKDPSVTLTEYNINFTGVPANRHPRTKLNGVKIEYNIIRMMLSRSNILLSWPNSVEKHAP